ncbi:elongator complex protein 1 [Anoplophora glabripennis]|nr:elongator complex protein 1 [Anoplophora glabripennis]
MDNLEQLYGQSVKIDVTECGNCISYSSSQELTCFISDKNYVCIYEHANLDRPIAKKIEGKELKQIHYLAVYDVIFLATDYEFILCDRYTFQCNVSYLSEKRIVALAWNPSETAVVIIDEVDKIILCNFSTPKFEIQNSNYLSAEVPGSVYVGWGSENTQFQGLTGRQHKGKEKVSVPIIHWEYSPPNISWRGNGLEFAINFYKNGQRFIKVFSNQLQPLNVSSEYPNLTEPIAFMVAGQCIACACVADVNSIVIFEKNCKVKSTFEVPENKGTIQKIQYHPQMNMLAVYSLDDKESGYINIYLNGNGIWHLKQQLYFPPNRRVQDFKWINLHEPLYTICRMVIFINRSVEYYTFRFIINRCPSTSVLAVVNGRSISIYNFAEKIIPPPMSNSTLTHSRPINRILFHPKKLLLVALNSLLQVLIVNLENFNSKVLIWEDINFINAPSLYNIIWNENKIQINCGDCDDEIHEAKEDSKLIFEINTIKKAASKFVLPYNDTNCLTSHQSVDAETITLTYLTKKEIQIKNSKIELDFALSCNRELCLNGNIICNGVTSFFIFQDYLLLTTASCKLYCIRLLQDADKLLHSSFKLEKTYSREIEQGARIVTISKCYPPLITMVLPRGNLETIRCRLLTIDIVEKLLSENKWKTAVNITRIERMNWNLLIDLNPVRFSDHIKDFVKAAEFCTNLSTIVNDFTNKNTYLNCLPNSTNQVCDKTEIVRKIISYLISTDPINNLLSIISIQQKHFSLKSALNYIKVVFELNPHSNDSICKKSLQLLSNKGHFKDILDAAYSLYSLDFLTFVYHNSTEDPRVYEPEIAAFRKLKPVQLRFKMNLRANNIKEAVKYLLRCDNYDLTYVETFILKHKLEDVAYKCLPPFCKHFDTVSTLYAKRLSLKQKHDEAAFVLKRANLITHALEEYKAALDWREVVSIMKALNYNQDDQRKILYDLSSKLSAVGRVDDAVLLLNNYNDDHKKATQLLIEHKAFKKAIYLAKEYNAVEILEELVIPALKSYMLDLKDKIDEFEVTFIKYFHRLQLLREEKIIKLENSMHDVYDRGEDDLYSETGSTVSSYGSSRATSRSRSSQFSSKNRRKEERKKIDLREGGYYEDIALIRALYILYNNVFSLGKDVREVCTILEHGDLQLAKSLHVSLSCLQDLMKKHIPLIWPDVFINVPQVLDNTALAIIENKAYLDPAYCIPPDVLFEEWKLEIFS